MKLIARVVERIQELRTKKECNKGKEWDGSTTLEEGGGSEVTREENTHDDIRSPVYIWQARLKSKTSFLTFSLLSEKTKFLTNNCNCEFRFVYQASPTEGITWANTDHAASGSRALGKVMIWGGTQWATKRDPPTILDATIKALYWVGLGGDTHAQKPHTTYIHILQ